MVLKNKVKFFIGEFITSVCWYCDFSVFVVIPVRGYSRLPLNALLAPPIDNWSPHFLFLSRQQPWSEFASFVRKDGIKKGMKVYP